MAAEDTSTGPTPPDGGRASTVERAADQLQHYDFGPLLVPACSDLLVLLDEDRVVCYVSPSVARLLGRTSDEIVGGDLFGLVHPADREAVVDRLATSATELDWGDSIECRMGHADGSWRVMELYSRSLEEDRDVVGGSVATLRDVTTRKEYERALERSGQHERLLTLVPSPVLVLTDEGGLLYANRSAVKVLDSGALEDLLGRSLLDLLVPEYRAGLQETLRRTVSGDHGADIQVRLSPEHSDQVLDLDLRLLAVTWEREPAVVALAHDVSDWASARAELQRRALFDDLTGLPNRALLQERLEHALARARRTSRPPMVMFLDLDRFKTINDSLGHRAGDRLLQEVARRLQTVVRPQDTVARFGGDEFVVLIEDADGAEHALGIARRVADALLREVELDGTPVGVNASVGIAGAPEVPGGAPDDIIQAADTAMYRAKARGGGIEFYTPALQREALRRLQMETDLQRAVHDGGIRLAFQPIVSLSTREVVGVEALARWTHARHGVVNPEVFVALAEETRLIGALGHAVLEQAYRQIHAWRAARLVGEGFALHVNVSARQLSDDGLVSHVRDLLDRHRDGVALQLELTESVLMGEHAGTEQTLQALRALGVGVAIDDFGTGYSSLAYLSALPVDTLKLDRRFVGRLDDERAARVAGAVVALSRVLELDVVAEGVETDADKAALHDLGVDRAQGYAFGRPMTAAAMEELLAAGPPRG